MHATLYATCHMQVLEGCTTYIGERSRKLLASVISHFQRMSASIERTAVRIGLRTHHQLAVTDIHIGFEYGIYCCIAIIDKLCKSIPILRTLDAEEIFHHQRYAFVVLYRPVITQFGLLILSRTRD